MEERLQAVKFVRNNSIKKTSATLKYIWIYNHVKQMRL